jgi:hypothetical protein
MRYSAQVLAREPGFQRIGPDMKFSLRTLERLADIICGNTKASPYRSGPMLIDFFNRYGEIDEYGRSFPARHTYTVTKLQKLNGTDVMKSIVCGAFDFFDEPGFNAEQAATDFNRTLTRDGFRLAVEYGPGWMECNRYVRGNPRIEVRKLTPVTVVPEGLLAISHEAVAEQISKANTKLEAGDFAGAISSAYTLVEQLLKLMLWETGATYKEDEGDTRSLYKALRGPLGLDPSEPSIENSLKPILDGFQKLVSGLYEIANKASDRHARRYNPAGHHAKLAVNAAFALCEFLVESYKYQKLRRQRL